MDYKIERIREMKPEELGKGPSYFKEPIEVTDENIVELLEKYPLLVVECCAPWSMPCRMIDSIIKELSKEYDGKVVFGKLNVSENRKVTLKFRVITLPTLLFFKEKQAVDTLVGKVSKEQIEAKIKPILSSFIIQSG